MEGADSFLMGPGSDEKQATLKHPRIIIIIIFITNIIINKHITWGDAAWKWYTGTKIVPLIY